MQIYKKCFTHKKKKPCNGEKQGVRKIENEQNFI